MIKNPRISPDMMKDLKASKQKVREFLAFLPYDKAGCDCNPLIKEIAQRIEQNLPLIYLRCPRSLDKKFKKYKVICNQCQETVAFVYSIDSLLTDWCDLHYYNYCDQKRWYGGATINLSPVDQKLGFECFCGNDTRDFRLNATLPPKQIHERLNKREFRKPDSGFRLERIDG